MDGYGFLMRRIESRLGARAELGLGSKLAAACNVTIARPTHRNIGYTGCNYPAPHGWGAKLQLLLSHSAQTVLYRFFSSPRSRAPELISRVSKTILSDTSLSGEDSMFLATVLPTGPQLLETFNRLSADERFKHSRFVLLFPEGEPSTGWSTVRPLHAMAVTGDGNNFPPDITSWERLLDMYVAGEDGNGVAFIIGDVPQLTQCVRNLIRDLPSGIKFETLRIDDENEIVSTEI
jgi:hypothetical protein